jgi:hypothetical protein
MLSLMWIQSVLRRRVAAGYTDLPTLVEARSRGMTIAPGCPIPASGLHHTFRGLGGLNLTEHMRRH